MSLDTILWLSGILAEATVILFCFRARLFSSTPVFGWYLIWSLFVDLLFYSMKNHALPYFYFRAYEVEMTVDAFFQFAVLLELGWNILRPIRASLPRQSILIVALLIIVAGVVIWPIAAQTTPLWVKGPNRFFVQMQQTFAVLRITIFIGLAGFSQMLSIGWRNRELQIATGLGFYSMCSLAISVTHNHQNFGPGYTALDQLGVASYICSLGYWIVSFAQQEEERQEFTPQMSNFLLAVTGAARSARISVSDSNLPGPHNPKNNK
ncbi:MAG TPA: hypothetical protein VGG85_17600 [Terracidiphilus sp.]